ncbi:MAG: response regulator [Pirellulaceae bacterium]|nr:response regulator [Pirellulaceae bacterium]
MVDRDAKSHSPPSLQVLMVEDNDDHAALLLRALKRADGDCSVQRVQDGCEALDYLRAQAPFDERVWPHIVLLDINLPKLSGHEVLKQIRNDEQICTAVVIVMSTSEGDRDVIQAYRECANAYVTKPTQFQELCVMMNDLVSFWASWNVTVKE